MKNEIEAGKEVMKLHKTDWSKKWKWTGPISRRNEIQQDELKNEMKAGQEEMKKDLASMKSKKKLINFWRTELSE